MVINLDDPASFSQIDKENMLKHLLNFPEDLKRAVEKALNIDVPKKIEVHGSEIEYGYPKKIIFCGMGGSAIGGNVILDLAWRKEPVPMTVVRGYHLPAYIDKDTLVICVSYSGNTEETLSCFLEAIKNNAMIFAISSDGILLKYAEKLKIPYYQAPSGYPPRAAILHLFTPALVFLEKLGVTICSHQELLEVYNELVKERESLTTSRRLEENEAKKLAVTLEGRYPIIYTYRPYASAGYRFKCQLNENAKIPARFDVIPELCHNEIMGWEPHGTPVVPHPVVVFVRGSEEEDAIKARIEFISKFLKEQKVPVVDVKKTGKRLECLLKLIYLLDFTSYYLAILREVDPTPVKLISKQKKYLEENVNMKARLLNELEKLIG